MLFHQPVCDSMPLFIFLNESPVLRKKVTGIHSPATIKSTLPSLSKSVHKASVTIPIRFNSGQYWSVTSTNFPPSFFNRELAGVVGYCPETTLPPTNKSSLPSPSKSAALTQEPLEESTGSAVVLFIKCPVPSFKNNRSLAIG